MSLSPDHIKSSSSFKHILTLNYNDIITFVFDYLKKYTFPVIFGYMLSAVLLIWLIFNRIGLSGEYPFITILLHSLTGFILLPVLLVLPHEFLHIIPYWLSGARNIRIGAKPAELYFYVTAHNYPVGGKQFILIALTPFIALSVIMVSLTFFLPPLWQWSVLAALFMHTTMCAGDLALINFYWVNRDKKIITWDDTDLQEAYFYEIL